MQFVHAFAEIETDLRGKLGQWRVEFHLMEEKMEQILVALVSYQAAFQPHPEPEEDVPETPVSQEPGEEAEAAPAAEEPAVTDETPASEEPVEEEPETPASEGPGEEAEPAPAAEEEDGEEEQEPVMANETPASEADDEEEAVASEESGGEEEAAPASEGHEEEDQDTPAAEERQREEEEETSAEEDWSGLPSRGSAGHARGLCRPCRFYIKGDCWHGSACEYCHYPHSKRSSTRKKQAATAQSSVGQWEAPPLQRHRGRHRMALRPRPCRPLCRALLCPQLWSPRSTSGRGTRSNLASGVRRTTTTWAGMTRAHCGILSGAPSKTRRSLLCPRLCLGTGMMWSSSSATLSR